MAAINYNAFHLSKIQNDFLALTNKLEHSIGFIEKVMQNKVHEYLYTNRQMTTAEYEETHTLLSNIHEDTTTTMRKERLAIDHYISFSCATVSCVSVFDDKLENAYTKYIEKRKKYFQIYDKAEKMWQSSLHNERGIISTSKMTEPCAICCKKHGSKCTLVLSCNHTFGIKCFHKWIDTCIDQQKVVTCPLCRETNV